MRIALIGPSGTGKTSTLNEWVKKHPEYEVCPVGSREITKEMGFESPYEVDAKNKRKEFQHLLFQKKSSWEKERSFFITDRTHLDNLIYSVMHDCVRTATPKFIKKVMEATGKNYDLIFVFRSEDFINTGEDKQRVHDIEYHQTFEFLMDRFMSDPRLESTQVYRVGPGTPSGRADFMDAMVKRARRD